MFSHRKKLRRPPKTFVPKTVIDPFSILGLPRTLTPDPEAVEQSWRERTRDSGEGDEMQELHRARALLSDPVSRLEQWLRLHDVSPERGSAIAPEMMDLFSRLHEVLAETDEVIARMKQATTALTRAVHQKAAVGAQLRIQECMQRIQGEKGSRTDRFPEFETAAEHSEFAAAAETLGQLKFLRKWEQQCQERLLSLLEF